jgi:pimeloyl-ACP methyl ester carboxylesterase
VYFDDLGGLDTVAELVLIDTRGSGLSRPADPPSLTVHRVAQDVAELCAHLGEPAPVLLGHSFGCRILAEYAAMFPGTARALIMLTPPTVGVIEAVVRGRDEILALRDQDPALAAAVEAARALPAARPRDRQMLEGVTVPLWYANWDEEAHAHAGRAAVETPARTALTLRQSAIAVPPPDLATLDVPMLLVAGQLDYLSPPPAVHALHATLIDSTYAEIEGAGHYPWLDAALVLRDVIGEFLDALRTRGVR